MRGNNTIKGKPARSTKRKRLTLRAGTKRARLLAAMTAGTHTADGCAAKAGMTRHQAMVAARSIWVRTGVGYGVDERGRFVAVYPQGVTIDDVVRAD